MSEASYIPWYNGMMVRWRGRKPHHRTVYADPVGLRKPEFVDIRPGEVFAPSEKEYAGIKDLVEVVGAGLVMADVPPAAPPLHPGNEGQEHDEEDTRSPSGRKGRHAAA